MSAEQQTVTSADGTTIAYQAYGEGRPVIIVGGATNIADDWAELASALGEAGFTGVTYDRRGRGGSGDTTPYAVEREVEDVAALIEALGGGPVGLHSVSSGGGIAYRAAAAGLPVATVSAFETPYRVGEGPELAADYTEHLQELYDADRSEDMFEYFLTTAVNMPAEAVEQMKQSPFWAERSPVGRTILYDAHCIEGDSHLPSDLLGAVDVPVLSLCSTGSPDWLRNAAAAAAEALPDARLLTVEGEFHNAPTAVLVPVLSEHHRR